MSTTIQSSPVSTSSGASKHSTAPANFDRAKVQTNTAPAISKPKNAPSLEERSFFVGLFFDLIKTLTRITTGSYLPSVISNFIKDSHVTMEESITKTTFDDLCSRFACDFINTITERLFNGKTKILGFTLPHLPSEISSQLLAIQTVFASRTATRHQNVSKKSAKHHSSPEEQELAKEVAKRPIAAVADTISKYFETKIKPSLDTILKYSLGIHDSQVIKDSQGKVILKEDGEPLKTQPKVNYPWFFTSIGGSFLASMLLLPKKTQQAGFADVKGSPLRGFLNILWNTFNRLNTTVVSSSTNIHLEGKNFDACFENSVQDKTFLPFVQYTCDALASVLSDRIPFINGFTLSTIMRIVTEVPITFLKSGVQRIAKNNRISPEWSYLSYKILKPFANLMEKLTKPAIKFLTQNVYTRFPLPFIYEWRIFDPKIKNMYDIDIQKNKSEAKEGSEQFEDNWLKTLWLLTKHTFLSPFEVYDLVKDSGKQYEEKVTKIDNVIKTHEAKLEAEKLEKQLAIKLEELGVDPNQVKTKPEIKTEAIKTETVKPETKIENLKAEHSESHREKSKSLAAAI